MRKPPDYARSAVALSHDVIMAALSIVLAFYLRLGDDIGQAAPGIILHAALAASLIGALVFSAFGLYRGVWRFASLLDLSRIVQASLATIAGVTVYLFFVTRLDQFPRGVLIISFILLVFLLGGSRLFYRVFKDTRGQAWALSRRADPILVIGANEEADDFIRQLRRSGKNDYRVISLITIDKGYRGSAIQGVRVDGNLADLERVLWRLGNRGFEISRIALTASALSEETVSRVVKVANEFNIPLFRIPATLDLQSGVRGDLELRPVRIEDLLGRPQTKLSNIPIQQFIRGKRVLVTGAGGSIGSELARQIASYGPGELTLFDSSEFNLYSIDLDIHERYPELGHAAVIGDVRDTQRIEQIFGRQAPEIVFHAAALKHVPLVEMNPNEGVLTNVIGTRNIADACERHKVETMVLISTDKAVNPANVMGATKRLAESYCQSLSLRMEASQRPTRFVTVRFGNVLGSTGSVVPRFRKQLQAGGPITLTHPDITRYFMTISEAVELVLHAAQIGSKGVAAGGKIFVLNMGEPVRIMDLAKRMIELSGLKLNQDIQIEITGLRPGEKLYEELLHDGEAQMPTERAGIMLAQPRVANYQVLERALKKLEDLADRRDGVFVLRLMKELVPEFAEHAAPMETAQVIKLQPERSSAAAPSRSNR